MIISCMLIDFMSKYLDFYYSAREWDPGNSIFNMRLISCAEACPCRWYFEMPFHRAINMHIYVLIQMHIFTHQRSRDAILHIQSIYLRATHKTWWSLMMTTTPSRSRKHTHIANASSTNDSQFYAMQSLRNRKKKKKPQTDSYTF